LQKCSPVLVAACDLDGGLVCQLGVVLQFACQGENSFLRYFVKKPA